MSTVSSITVKDCHSYWPLPHDEEERFKTVLAFKVLDTQEDPVLQSLCVLARTLMGTAFAGKPASDHFAKCIPHLRPAIYCKTSNARI